MQRILKESWKPNKQKFLRVRRPFLLIICSLLILVPQGGCTVLKKSDYMKVHKPIRHKKPYDPKKNRYSKRIKVTKMRR